MELKHLIIGVLLAGASLAAGTATAGDDDKAPAYRIYIDPETGRYTTEDPLAPSDPGPVVAAPPPPTDPEEPGQSTGALLSIATLVAVLAGGVAIYRRQPTT